MNRALPYALAGLAIGSFIGLSTGVVASGGGVNGIFVFGPIGAFIGWLLSKRGNTKDLGIATLSIGSVPEQPKLPMLEPPLATKVLHAVFVFFALVWNAHVYALDKVSVLPTFIQKPWLFFVLGIVISIPFPPLLGIYFCAYLGASHFGMSENTGYHARITDLPSRL